jgi:hypothetical protein
MIIMSIVLYQLVGGLSTDADFQFLEQRIESPVLFPLSSDHMNVDAAYIDTPMSLHTSIAHLPSSSFQHPINDDFTGFTDALEMSKVCTIEGFPVPTATLLSIDGVPQSPPSSQFTLHHSFASRWAPSRLFAPLMQWDGLQFGRIASRGYLDEKQFAFFPLYPALLRGLASALQTMYRAAAPHAEVIQVTVPAASLPPSLASPGPALALRLLRPRGWCARDAIAAAVALLALALPALLAVALHGLYTAMGVGPGPAATALLALALLPASPFLHAAYTEALFALLFAAATHLWVKLQKKNSFVLWLSFLLLLLLASATRSNGVLLLALPLWRWALLVLDAALRALSTLPGAAPLLRLADRATARLSGLPPHPSAQAPGKQALSAATAPSARGVSPRRGWGLPTATAALLGASLAALAPQYLFQAAAAAALCDPILRYRDSGNLVFPEYENSGSSTDREFLGLRMHPAPSALACPSGVAVLAAGLSLGGHTHMHTEAGQGPGPGPGPGWASSGCLGPLCFHAAAARVPVLTDTAHAQPGPEQGSLPVDGAQAPFPLPSSFALAWSAAPASASLRLSLPWPAPALYASLQRKHWGVAPFAYYRPEQAPNFALAAPVFAFVALACLAARRAAAAAVEGPISASASFSSPPGALTLRACRLMGDPHAHAHAHGRALSAPAVLLPLSLLMLACAAVAAVVMHIQVATRFILTNPAAPLLLAHLWRSQWDAEDRGAPAAGRWGLYCMWWCVGYTVVGSAAFALSLPWT